jgi:hypothetical protein
MTLERRPRVILRWAPNHGAGWQPIIHLVSLLSRLLGAEVQEIGSGVGSAVRRMTRAVLPVRPTGEDVVIYLVFHPRHIQVAVGDPAFDQPAALRILWIVDSFWTEDASARLLRNFDRVVYMQSADAGFYETASGGKALCAPWGADVLDLGGEGGVRDMDILRIGRQPDAWDDDARTAAAAAPLGLRFHGRPPLDTPYESLMDYYRRSRFVVAFSNLAAPAPHTHPTKAYFTGRWTDALANGAVVAGVHPVEDAGLADSLWDGALLSFDRIDLGENLAALARAAAAWTPEVARHNHLRALERLDWRWRLRDLAKWIGLSAPALDDDLGRLADRVERLRQA